MIRFLISILFLATYISVFPQKKIQLSHYTVDDGLSEVNVTFMLQDKKGNMWFSTFDGLNKFDGYSFSMYKNNINHKYSLLNYRINRIKEDNDGFIWIQSNDGRIYRFDPSTEFFLPIPQGIENYENFNHPLKIVSIQRDGSIWVAGINSNNDLFKITNSKDHKIVTIKDFSNDKTNGAIGLVDKIYLDQNKNTWILTSKNVYQIKCNSNKVTNLKRSLNESRSYAICGNYPFIYLGNSKGIVEIYNNRTNTFENIQTPCQSNIITLDLISKKELFILTDKSGFFLYDLASHKFTTYNMTNGCGLKTNILNSSYIDKQHNIWLNAGHSNIVYLETAKNKIYNFTLSPDKSNQILLGNNFHVLEDKNNNIWVHPDEGSILALYNRTEHKLEPLCYETNTKNEVLSNLARAISDQQGNLWISSNSNGVYKVVFRQSPFIFHKIEPKSILTEQNHVRSIYQDSENWLWIGARNGFLYIFDNNRKLAGTMGIDGKINGTIPLKANVYKIINDHSGTIWIASRREGLFRLEKTNLKTHSYKITNYRHNPFDKYSLSSNEVFSIFLDNQNRLWIATFGGGINLLENKNNQVRFINYQNQFKTFPIQECLKTRYITEDKFNRMYVGTTNGMLVFRPEYQHPERTRFYHYTHDPKDDQTLTGNDITYILPAKNGNLYIATLGGGFNIVDKGINLEKKNIFQSYSKSNGTFSDIVYSLEEDSESNIWISTQTKLAKYNPKSKIFEIYSPVTNSTYTFFEAAVYKTTQSDLIYGTTEGFIEFNPLNATKSTFIPRIILTQLQIQNKTMEVNGKGSPLSLNVDNMDEIKLSHTQDIISIGYSALDFTVPKNIQYAFKLDGVDADWNYVGDQRIATYDNLHKGHYIFHVKSTNADGVWVNNEKSIRIYKAPSFWESSWGILFYFVSFIFISFIVSFVLFRFYKLKHAIDIEHRLTNMKLRFFTDVSHELRTPLTLIALPLENILRTEELSRKIKDQLTVAHRNTERMMRLINQILDFRKVQNKKMNLVIEDIHVNQYVTEICNNFLTLSQERKIDFKIQDNSNDVRLWVDKDKFEKIFFNLLSNAFKFTLPNNSIQVIIDEENDSVSITIRDNGIGIGNEMLKKLFSRFESLVTADHSIQASTGIGLSLTKELIEMHKGKIDVDSEIGKGSSFKVIFPKGHQHYNDNSGYILHDLDKEKSDAINNLPLLSKENTEQDLHPKQESSTILIVEDNVELRNLLVSILQKKNTILEASNGNEALVLLPDCAPDIIISDIMMPVMDGLQFTKTIKEDINLSHIPVILLTAKGDIDSKLEAMKYCVDDYIVKPFSSVYLEARIENILKLRKQLHDYYQSVFANDSIKLAKPNISTLDDNLIKKIVSYIESNIIVSYIESNIDDSELSIDAIASYLGLSRSSLFKKIKSLIGLAPVDFIKDIRLQRSSLLIKNEEYNISQIAYMVGFDDPRYFSKCFKLKYGVTPSEFKNK